MDPYTSPWQCEVSQSMSKIQDSLQGFQDGGVAARRLDQPLARSSSNWQLDSVHCKLATRAGFLAADTGPETPFDYTLCNRPNLQLLVKDPNLANS